MAIRTSILALCLAVLIGMNDAQYQGQQQQLKPPPPPQHGQYQASPPGVPPQQYQHAPGVPPQQYQQAQGVPQQQQYQHAPGVPPQQYQQAPTVPQQQQQQQYQQPPQQQQYQQPPQQQQYQQQQHQQQQHQQQQHQQHQQQQQFQQQGHAHQPHQNQRVLHTPNIGKEREHIKEHLEVPIDTSDMSEKELQYHYFKMHDADNNNKLDGQELIKSLFHWHDSANHDPAKSGHPPPEAKIFTDNELIAMIDPILEEDDKNKDGFIDYPEFVQAQHKAAAAAAAAAGTNNV